MTSEPVLPSCGVALRRVSFFLTLCVLTNSWAQVQTGTALVRHAPQVNGFVEGSIQQTTGEGLTLNGGAIVTEDLRVPGSPTIRKNGKPHFGGVVDEAGAVNPSNYQITLNGNATLGRVVRRVDPEALPVVTAPVAPGGNRHVNINHASESPGDFSTLRNLTLNGGVGQFAVPAGAYGDFTANGGSGFTLGVVGAQVPAVYHFQRLTLNGDTRLEVVGPVQITVAYGLNLNGEVGDAAHPSWLTLRVYSGGLTVNGDGHMWGFLVAPNGNVHINGEFTGGVAADRLTVNGGGVLRLRAFEAPNQSPVATDTVEQVDEDAAVAFTLAANDPDGDPLTYTILSGPSHGTLTGSLPALTYTPAPDFDGDDALTFQVSDGVAASAVATVSFDVVPVNDAPIAASQTAMVPEDEPLVVTLAGSDVEDTDLTFAITAAPAHGSVTLVGAEATYMPNANFFGTDTLRFTANDGSLTSVEAEVVVEVQARNDAPLAQDRSLAVDEGATIPVDLVATDIDGDILTYEVLSGPTHGNLSGTVPTLTYTPPANFDDVDTVTFRAFDGATYSAVGTITIQVTNLNDPPQAASQSLATAEDEPLAITLTGSDPDGDGLNFTITVAPSHGTLTGAAPNLIYEPAADFHGDDEFLFSVNDGEFDSAPVAVAIAVAPRNDAPLAVSDEITIDEDAVTEISLVGTDVDGDVLSFEIVTAPAHGGLSGSGAARTYTPAADYHGDDAFTFRTFDGEAFSEPAAITIHLTPKNDRPVIESVVVATNEDTAVSFDLTVIDVDGDPVTVEITVPPLKGELSAGSEGNFVFTPYANENGDDSFTLVASDGELDSVPTLITLQIAAVNDAPVAVDESVVTDRNVAVDLALAATDVDGDELTYQIVAAPQQGTLTGDLPNLTYTPTFDFAGPDSFTFTATDGSLTSNLAAVSITIIATNRAPVAEAIALALDEDQPALVTLPASDADGDPLTYTIATHPAHGVLSGTAPDLTYTPEANYNGSDEFSYFVSDAATNSATATVSLSISPQNDAPVAVPAELQTLEDVPVAIELAGSDIEGDALTYAITLMPQFGTLSGAPPALVYTPGPNFNGGDIFEFAASDGQLATTAPVVISVIAVNDAPTAEAQAITTDRNLPVAATLSGADVDGDALTFSIVAPPQHGALSGTAPHLIYTPEVGYVGSDSFTYLASDGQLASPATTVTIEVLVTNLAPLVDAGDNQVVRFGGAPAGALPGRIVVHNDEWAFTDAGYETSRPDTENLLRNLTRWFVDGRPGRFLGYAKTIPGSVEFSYTESSFIEQMAALGHHHEVSYEPQLTLERMLQFDGVFLAANEVNNADLIAYVEAGGCVFVGSGTRWSGDIPNEGVLWWGEFLNHFGLAYAVGYNSHNGRLPVTYSDHPLLSGVEYLNNGNGNNVYLTGTNAAKTAIIWRYQGAGLLGVYDGGESNDGFFLKGEVSDEDGPADAPNLQWTLLSGPGPVQIAAPNELLTRIHYEVPGIYTFALSADDGDLVATDTVEVWAHQPPEVSAGSDRGGRVGAAIPLEGTATDDGLPEGLDVHWSVLAGPGDVVFSDPSDANGIAMFDTAGLYVMRIEASDGAEVASDLTEVRVGLSSPDNRPDGLVAWWTANQTPEDAAGGLVATLGKGTAYTDGKVGAAFAFDGIDDFWRVPAHPNLDVGLGDGFAIEFWMQPDASAGRLMHWRTIAGAMGVSIELGVYQGTNRMVLTLNDTAGQGHQVIIPDFPTVGVWQHVVISYERSSGRLRVYRDGRLRHEQLLGSFVPQTSYDLFINHPPHENNVSFAGRIDELSLYSQALTGAEAHALFAADRLGKVPFDNNAVPVVDAGEDAFVASLDTQLSIEGSVLDDGNPAGGIVATAWRVISGPAAATFTDASALTTQVSFPAEGIYVLELRADDGGRIATDTLEVTVLQQKTPLPAGVVAWWPGNSNPRDVVEGSHGSWINAPVYTAGQVAGAFSFTGNSRVEVAPTDRFDQTDWEGMTIEFWLRPGEVPSGFAEFISSRSAAGEPGLSVAMTYFFGWRLAVEIWGQDGTARSFQVDSAVTPGVWQHFAISYDRATGTARMVRNGALLREVSLGSFTPRTEYGFAWGAVRDSNGVRFSGELDEITLYDRALSTTELAAIHAAGAGGKSAPAFGMPPTVDAGDSQVAAAAGDVVALAGVVADDGLPAGNVLRATWSVEAGPGTVSFSDEHAVSTTAVFDSPGLYVLRLAVTDGLFAPVSDLTEVRVESRAADVAAGLVAWWPFNETGVEHVQGVNHAELQSGASFGNGYVSSALNLDGVNDHARVAAHDQLDIGSAEAGFTIEFWARPGRLQLAEIASWGTPSADGLIVRQNTRRVEVHLIAAGGASASMVVDGVLETGVWRHVAITYDPTTGLGRVYRNGRLVREQGIGTLRADSTLPLTFGLSLRDGRAYQGALDEFSLWDRPLDATEIRSIYAAGADGKMPLDDNERPSVNAGSDFYLASSLETATLVGSVTDDGKPVGLLTSAWSVEAGPGNVIFGDEATPSTTARFEIPGTYQLKLSATDGYGQPKEDRLEVRVGVGLPPATAGLQLWWPGNGHVHEVMGNGPDMAFIDGPGFGSGRVAQAFQFNGSSDFARVSAHPGVDVSSDGISIEFWALPSRTGNQTLLQTWSGSQMGMQVTNDGFNSLNWSIVDTANQSHGIGISGQFVVGEWSHWVLSYDRHTGVARIFRNGSIQAEKNLGIFQPVAGMKLSVGSPALSDGRHFQGSLDELAFYDRALTIAEVRSIYWSGADGKAPPSIGAPPVVSAGDDVTLVSGTRVTDLNGYAIDDRLPIDHLETAWSLVTGPGSVTLGDATAPQTPATFERDGTYLLQLSAYDGVFSPVADFVEVRIGPDAVEADAALRLWWTANGHPHEALNAVHDIELANGVGYATGQVLQAFHFDGWNDYGRVEPHDALDVGSSMDGFTYEFWARTDVASGQVYLQLADGDDIGMFLASGSFHQLRWQLRDDTGQLHDIIGDIGSVNNWEFFTLTYDRHTGVARFWRNAVIRAEKNIGNVRLRTDLPLWLARGRDGYGGYFRGEIDELSIYGRALGQAEIQATYAAGAAGKVPSAVNTPPEVTTMEAGAVFVGVPVTLSGTVTDDGLPDPPAALTYVWTRQSGPGAVAVSDPAALSPTFTFDTAGTHVLRLTVDDGELTAFDEVTVEVSEAPDGTPPSITIVEPGDGDILLADTYFEIAAIATDDVAIAKVEFFSGTEKLGEQTLPSADEPDVYFWPLTSGLPVGRYTFTAVATDSSGLTTTSPEIAITVSDDPDVIGAGVFIASPGEDSRISAPTKVTGVIASGSLQSWNLEYRLRPAGDDTAGSTEPWITFASGTDPVGTPASTDTPAVPAVIASFDPTLLLNGIYELRLNVVTAGGTTTYGPITVVVDGNMKIGAFSVAFEDLSVPTPGIPISITRTYDSRDQRVGDFGPGWWIAVGNVRVQKNRNLGTAWWQTPQSGDGIQFYDVLPIDDRIVTVALPDGETHRFRAGAYVKNRPGDPDYRSFGVVVREGLYKFYPVGDTTATLEPIDATGALADQFWIEGTGDQDLFLGQYGDFDFIPYNPTCFRLTTSDGTVMILDEQLGLLEVHDLTGNTLAIGRDASHRIDTITSTQVTEGAPIDRVVSIVRDATGRVDYIQDLVGNQIDYLYDPEGRLQSVTDRELNTTQFFYENPAFPTYLTRILDPRGVPALRSEYDPDGRLIKQIDADGNETNFDRGIDTTGRFETITDRLGNPTTYYYDDRGNITTKFDALGAQTDYTYYPDTDRVRLEIDHYGNVKSMVYDERGNITVETIGADATEDPASPTIGYTTRTTYNSRSAPLSITDPDGRVQSFTYDPDSNNLLTHTIAEGTADAATTTYTYNTDGTLDTITDATLTVTDTDYDYAYSDAVYPTATQLVTTTVTDAGGTVLRSTRAILDAQQNQLASIITRTLPEGTTEDIVTSYRYDAENRLVATILPDGRVTETRYTSFGAEEATVLWKSVADYEAGDDANARITSHSYDSRGNETSTTYADGTSELRFFDSENRKTWTQDRRGYRTFMVYDALGRQRFTIHPDDNDGVGDAAPVSTGDPRLADNPRSETVYDLVGRVTDTYDELGHRTEFIYEDGCSCYLRRKQSIQHLVTGHLTTSYQYDKAGNVTHVTDPRGNTTETRYDHQGRPYLVIHPATDEHPITETETVYDVLGRRVAMSDQEGKLTRYRYDGLGRLVEVRQYLDQSLAASDADFALDSTTAGVVSTTYSYDEAGNQQTQTDALGRVTSYTTDALGRRLTRTLPSDPANGVAEVSEVLDYDEWGNLWHRTDFAGHTTTFAYDELNRLESKTADPSHPSLIHAHAIARIEYDYDDNGARIAARTFNASNAELYTEATPRDERGRLDYKDTAAGRLDYGYHANNLLEDVVSSNADGVNLGYRYDEANRLAYVDDASTGLPVQTTGYTYNDNGSLETVATPSGVTYTYTYDTLNRLRTLNVTHVTAGSLHHYTYALRASGHRETVTEGPSSAGPFKVTTYAYDDLYRLTGEKVTGAATAAELGTISYDLDKVGNRLTRLSSIDAVTDQTRTYNVRDWLDTDTYDANGNTVRGANALQSFSDGGNDTYDFEDRLILRTRSDGSTVNLAYDADGIRRQKIVINGVGTVESTTSYLVDTNNLTGYAQVFEERTSDAAGTTTKVYTYGSDLIAFHESSTTNPDPATHYCAYDGGSSVRELTDETGAITDTYVYDAFGVAVVSTGVTENAYLYRGEQWDADLGLYFLRARFMNPESGRFWNLDRYEGAPTDPISLHKYNYANVDPIQYFDSSGYCALSIIHNLWEYSRIGIEVHKFIQSHFRLSGPRRDGERAISTILNREADRKRRFSGREGYSLRQRVDLFDLNLRSIYEIKPILQKLNGASQIAGYLASLNYYSQGAWREGRSLEYSTIPTSFVSSDGSPVRISRPDAAGVITYVVGCSGRKIAQDVTVVAVSFAVVQSLIALQTKARVGAYAGIQTRLAFSLATGGKI